MELICRNGNRDSGTTFTSPGVCVPFAQTEDRPMRLYERTGWLGSRDLVFSNRDLGKRAGNFAIWRLQTSYGDKRVLVVRMASSCIACCIFHITSIPFNCSDTALRVAEAMIGTKVKIFVFLHVALFPNLAPELVPRIFGLFSLGTKGKIRPGNRASLVNQAHVKRPSTL